MALPAEALRSAPKGKAKPRIAPPTPARSKWREHHEKAAAIGIEFFPWQDTANRYVWALGPGERWLYPEVCVVVARQNGKTELLVPHIVERLLMGRRIMHTAQNRELPREVFGRVAEVFMAKHAGLLAKKPRFANGQEEIRLRNGGHYRIVAPTRGGARGPSNDDLIVDEVRELDNHDFIAAAKPTLNASPNPQVLYLSNAGDEQSEVLNALKRRADDDPSLAYLEWSASPERRPDDLTGWLESNPSAGHMPQIVPNLEREYRAHKLAGTLAIFETEHLCRWVTSVKPRLVSGETWKAGAAEITEPRRPALGLAMDPNGNRASAVIAWRQADDTFALRTIADVTGAPIDVGRLGPELRRTAAGFKARLVSQDPWSADLARYFVNPRKMSSLDFANASAKFVELVEAGLTHHLSDDPIGDDLDWLSRKAFGQGGWMAAVTSDEHPATAGLAAIRALWLASGPKPPAPRIL